MTHASSCVYDSVRRFLSNGITVSVVTSDAYTAHNLPAAPEEASYSHTQTYRKWQG